MRWILGGLVVAALVAAFVVLGDEGPAPRDVARDVPASGDDAATSGAPEPETALLDVADAEPRRLDAEFFGVTSFATFTGRVVALDEGGAPVEGAVVVHVPDATTLAASGLDVDALARIEGDVEALLPTDRMTPATTDADGRFSFRAPSLPIGAGRRWPDVPMLVVRHPDMATRPVRCAGFTGGDGVVCDLGEIGVQSGAVVTGRVVAGDDGEPLPDAEVSVWSASWEEVWARAVDVSRWSGLDHRRDFFRFTETRPGPDGRFELRGVVAGVLTVRVEHEVYAPAQPPTRIVGRGSTWDLGTLALPAGASLDVRVSARHTADGLPGALVTLYEPAAPLDVTGVDAEPLRRARTDDDGVARLVGLDEGLVVARVEARGYRDALHHDVQPGDGAVLDVELVPARHVVVWADDPAAVADAQLAAWGVVRQEDATAYVPLDVERLAEPLLSEGFAVVLDDADHDEIVLRASYADAPPELVDVERDDTTAAVHRPLRLAREGVVVDTSGAPVADATVRAWRHEPDTRYPDAPWSDARETTTDAGGRFAIVPPRPFGGTALRAWARDGGVSEIVVPEGNPLDDVTLRVSAGAAVDGFVIDAFERPVAAVEVVLDGDEVRRVVTRADGTFGVRGLAPGLYEARAEPGARTEFVAVSGRTHDVRLITSVRPTVRGQVRDGERASPFAAVAALDADGRVTAEALADVNGFFAFDLPAPGAHRLVAHDPSGRVTPPVPFTIAWRQTLDVDLRFGELVTRGVVRGAPPGLSAFVRLVDTSLGWSVPVDEAGAFVFEHLPNAPLEFGLVSRGVVIDAVQVDAPPPAALPPFELDADGTLVVSFGGRWAGRELYVRLVDPSGGEFVRRVSSPRGAGRASFVFDGLGEPRYDVRVETIDDRAGELTDARAADFAGGTLVFVQFE